jgi:hypothetical protein
VRLVIALPALVAVRRVRRMICGVVRHGARGMHGVIHHREFRRPGIMNRAGVAERRQYGAQRKKACEQESDGPSSDATHHSVRITRAHYVSLFAGSPEPIVGDGFNRSVRPANDVDCLPIRSINEMIAIYWYERGQ